MQPKNKPIKRRKYDADFKAEVLKMLANNRSAAYIAQALGISEALIYKWRQRVKGEEKQLSAGQTTNLLLENQRL